GGITCTAGTFTSTVATTLSIKPPGVLANCKDALGYPLNVAASPAPTLAGGTVPLASDGSFTANVTSSGPHTLTFTPQNAQGVSGAAAQATINFPAAT